MAKVIDVPKKDLERLRREMGEAASWLDRYPPDRLYYHKPTGKRGIIVTYYADGTCRFFVGGRWNLVLCERVEDDVRLDDLVECDVPDGNKEPLGVIIDDINAFENNLHTNALDMMKALLGTDDQYAGRTH